MNGAPERLRNVRQWVAKAENDLRNAEHTLTLQEECPFDTVCFHAQQCAEKHLKGLLVFRSIDFPKTHDLVILLRLLGAAESIAIEVDEVQPLNRYTIEARYPGDWEPITRPEAEEAVAIARRVRGAVRASLPKDALEQA